MQIVAYSGIPETTVRRWLRKWAPDECARRAEIREQKRAHVNQLAEVAARVIKADCTNKEFEEHVHLLDPHPDNREVKRIRVKARRIQKEAGYGYYARKAAQRDVIRRQFRSGATYGSLSHVSGGCCKSKINYAVHHCELSEQERRENREIIKRRTRRVARTDKPAKEKRIGILEGTVEERLALAEITLILNRWRPEYRVEHIGGNAPEDIWIIVPIEGYSRVLPVQVRKISFPGGEPTASVRTGGGKRSYSAMDCQVFVACDADGKSLYCVDTARVHDRRHSVRCYPDEAFSCREPEALLRQIDAALARNVPPQR